jgi:hypothetical protein
MKPVITTHEGRTFNIGASAYGRLGAAMERFVFVFAMLLIGGSLFFVPDYIGRYREQEPVFGFLFLALVITVLFVSLVAGALRLFRNDLWSVDAGEGLLVYQANRLIRKGFEQTAVELDMVRRFVVKLDDPPRESEFLVELEDHGPERIVEARFGSHSFRDAAEELREFLSAEGIDIPVEIEQK